MPLGLCPLESRCVGEGAGRAVTIEENPRLRESREAATDVNTQVARKEKEKGGKMIRRSTAAHLLHVATADCCRERLACEWWRWETRFATTLRSHHNRLLGEVTRVTKSLSGCFYIDWRDLRRCQRISLWQGWTSRCKLGRNNLTDCGQVRVTQRCTLCSNLKPRGSD